MPENPVPGNFSSQGFVFRQRKIILLSSIIIIGFVFLFIVFDSQQKTVFDSKPLYSAEIRVLDKISKEISSIERPPNARIAPEGLKQLQTGIDSDINASKAALAKGNVDEAREALIRVTQYIGNLQKSGNTVVIPKQMKDDHDPAGKYTKDRVVLDSGLFDYYFGVVDILVILDEVK